MALFELQTHILTLKNNPALQSSGRCVNADAMIYYCIKSCTKAINSRALTSKKPCINKESHVPLMHRSLTFHMQDSGQYSVSTEAA